MTSETELSRLVLSRRKNETIHIGDDIVVEVARVKGNSASIRIIAPRGMQVDRGEVFGRKLVEMDSLVPADGSA